MIEYIRMYGVISYIRAIPYRLKEMTLKVKRKIFLLATPMATRRAVHYAAWTETLFYPKDQLYRVTEFINKFGNFDDAFDAYWAKATWWSNPKYETPAASMISYWMLQDLFDQAIIGQLNSDNLLKGLFKQKIPCAGKAFPVQSNFRTEKENERIYKRRNRKSKGRGRRRGISRPGRKV